MTRRLLALLIPCCIALASSACGRYAVRPDEKEFLADRIMQPDYDAQDSAVEAHVLGNREAAAAAGGAGGGGCGCN